MFNLFRRTPVAKPPYLSYPEHYDETSRQAPGDKCKLSLVVADEDGLFVNLVYRWTGNLSHNEADRLDTRLRAYVACAIFDAAATAGLSCTPGPPHGQRPSWVVRGETMPISLVNAGFDVSDKTCFLQIGPGMLMLRAPQRSGRCNRKLIEGFKAQFSSIQV